MGSAQNKPRARELGIQFEGTAGPRNAITDVKGVEVGHSTLISGEGKLVVGCGARAYGGDGNSAAGQAVG